MTPTEARDLIRSVLRTVAPEADIDSVDPDDALQEALDLDSIDFLNLVIGIHEAVGIDIPERDYPQLATLGGFVDYLAQRPAPEAATAADHAPAAG